MALDGLQYIGSLQFVGPKGQFPERPSFKSPYMNYSIILIYKTIFSNSKQTFKVRFKMLSLITLMKKLPVFNSCMNFN